jgi:hypothetical protein
MRQVLGMHSLLVELALVFRMGVGHGWLGLGVVALETKQLNAEFIGLINST